MRSSLFAATIKGVFAARRISSPSATPVTSRSAAQTARRGRINEVIANTASIAGGQWPAHLQDVLECISLERPALASAFSMLMRTDGSRAAP